MTEYPMLFRTTKKDVKTIAKRVNETPLPTLLEEYLEKYGAGWKLKLSGDIIATAVEWCYRDFLDMFGKKPTMDTFERAFDEYDYWEMFKLAGRAGQTYHENVRHGDNGGRINP